jgi:hypothetical protein
MALPYGMDDKQLASIIDATNGAVAQMKSLNTGVQRQAEEYIRANNSESGRIMQEALYEWTDEFNQIVGDLDQLNAKVADVRRRNIGTSAQASSTAQGARR